MASDAGVLATPGRKLPKLILHFDVNETILVGDKARGSTFEDTLNRIIAKSAFVRKKIPEESQDSKATAEPARPTQWYDGSPIYTEEGKPAKVGMLLAPRTMFAF